MAIEGEDGDEGYTHVTNNFDEADIVVSGSGAEEINAADKKSLDEGEEDKQPAKVEGVKEAGASEEDGEEDEEGEDKQPPADEEEAKRKPRYERRIDTLTARNKELEERLNRLEKGEKPKEPEQRGEPPKEAADKPKLEDFETYEDWVDAVADYRVELKLKERDSKTKAAEANDSFSKRVVEGSKRFDDWADVVTDDIRVSPAAADAIKETEDPAAVIHFLGSNPDEAKRIIALSPTKQAVEIGKIEASLAKKENKSSTGDKPKGKVISEAPEPPKPPKGDGDKVTKSIDDMDADEYIRYMNKQRGVKLTL